MQTGRFGIVGQFRRIICSKYINRHPEGRLRARAVRGPIYAPLLRVNGALKRGLAHAFRDDDVIEWGNETVPLPIWAALDGIFSLSPTPARTQLFALSDYISLGGFPHLLWISPVPDCPIGVAHMRSSHPWFGVVFSQQAFGPGLHF